MRMLLAMIPLAFLGAGAVASAQSTAGQVTLAAPLPDGNQDGVIDVSAAGAKRYGVPGKGTWIFDPAAPRYTYRLKGSAPAPVPTPTPDPTPEPTPTPPASAVTATIVKGEAFAQTDAATFGWNAWGGLGTINAAPAGYRTDTATGLKRVGLYVPPLDDAILQGRAIDGSFVTAKGLPRRGNLYLTGFAQIPGKFVDPLTWAGATPEGIAIEQVVAPAGSTLAYTVTITNRTGKALSNLHYVRSADPDQSDLYNTTNTVIAPGKVEAKLQGKGGTFFLRSEDDRARIAITTYNKSAEIGAARSVGQSKTGDEVVQLVFALGDLAPGASVTVRFEMGVKR